MPITDFLAANAEQKPNEITLVEVNPEIREHRGTTWREYELVETNPVQRYRRDMTLLSEKYGRFCHCK